MPEPASSRWALIEPAWMAFQNSWVLPFGMTAMVYFCASAKADNARVRNATSRQGNFMVEKVRLGERRDEAEATFQAGKDRDEGLRLRIMTCLAKGGICVKSNRYNNPKHTSKP